MSTQNPAPRRGVLLCYPPSMEYLTHFFKVLLAFVVIVGLSLAGMQYVGGAF